MSDSPTSESNPDIIYKLLPPRTLDGVDPIRYSCSECGQEVWGYDTTVHAQSHNAASFTMDNVGDHISLDPTEHTADFDPSTPEEELRADSEA